MEFKKFCLIARNYCSDIEFINKLKYIDDYNYVMKDFKEKVRLEKYKEPNIKEKLSPDIILLINDYEYIIEKNKYYFYENYKIDLEEIRYYDIFINSMNQKRYVYRDKLNKFNCYISQLLKKIKNSNAIPHFLYIMILLKIIETNIGNKIINDFPNLKYTVYNKIEEFKNCNIKEFSEYVKNNYDNYKKFVSKTKNKRYYLRKIKSIIFTFYAFIKLYKKVQNNKNVL